jgi:hypothetical protein
MNADGLRLTSLGESMSPLRSWFNEAADTPRFLALVSPTCGPCLHGATAVRDTVAGVFQPAEFPIGLV